LIWAIRSNVNSRRDGRTEVSWVYRYLLHPGDQVVDGGAHIGYLTLLMASAVGAEGRVHAFEPISRTHDALQRNVALNRAANVVVNRMGLSDRSGELSLEVPIDPDGTGLLAWGASSIGLQRGPTEVVAATSLDAYADRRGVRQFGLVKLDLEGGESSALRGMTDLLGHHRVRYIVCELNSFLLDAAGRSYDETRRFCAAHGYTAFWIRKDSRLQLITGAITAIDDLVNDVLFAAPETVH
jgi:FkbM family methyltransferase